MKLLIALLAFQSSCFGAILFDGVNWATNNSVITTALGGTSMACWVKVTSTNAGQSTLFYNGVTASSGWGLAVGDGSCNGGLKALVTVGGLNCNYTGGAAFTLTTNVWHHIAATLAFSSPNFTCKLYVDGVQRSSTNTTSGPTTPTTSTIIGKQLNGQLSDCVMYARILGDWEIFQQYSAGRKWDMGASVLAYFPMDDGLDGTTQSTTGTFTNRFAVSKTPVMTLVSGTWKANSYLIMP